MMYTARTCRGEKLFPSFVAALKAKKDTDEESKKIGVLVQVLPATMHHSLMFRFTELLRAQSDA